MRTAPRCVLVDDDPSVLSMMSEFLRGICPQLEVVTFPNGLEALAFLIDSEADLVITDLRMPEMDGLELTSNLRLLEMRMPIVVMSGNGVAAQALAAGANAYLSKAEVPGKLRTLLGSLEVEGVDALSARTHST